MADEPVIPDHIKVPRWEDVDVIAAPPAGLTRGTTCGINWKQFENVPNFDIRNGAPEDIVPILIRATLAKRWHWVPVAGVPANMANKCIDGYIRSALHHLTANDLEAKGPTINRKLAIVLGTIRAVSTTFYRLSPADMNETEVVDPYLTALQDADGNIFYQPADALTEAEKTAILANLEFTEQEQAAISALIKAGVGVIPMQGYSLVMTNHHYLSGHETQSRRIFAVVEKATWKGQTIGDWFSNDLADLQDAAWHKACHPVSIKLKLDMAMDLEIKNKLNAADAGPCSSRLPAAEAELRTANSYLTLLGTVKTLFSITGGDIDTTYLENAYNMVRKIPPHAEGNLPEELIPKALRQIVVSRKTGIEFLGEMLRKNQDTVAYAYGFYVAQSEAQAMTSATPGSDTLRLSHSLKKLHHNSPASYTGGYEAFADYRAARTKKRAEGTYEAPRLRIMP